MFCRQLGQFEWDTRGLILSYFNNSIGALDSLRRLPLCCGNEGNLARNFISFFFSEFDFLFVLLQVLCSTGDF